MRQEQIAADLNSIGERYQKRNVVRQMIYYYHCESVGRAKAIKRQPIPVPKNSKRQFFLQKHESGS